MGWLESPGRRHRASREAAETAGFWSRERDSCGVPHCARWGPAPPPPWGKRLERFRTSLQNHSHLHLIFFSPAAQQGLLRSIYGANLGREHPPVGTGRPVGSPPLLLAAPWAQEGPRRRSSTAGPKGGLRRAAEAEQLCPRACTHHILFHLHVTHREHKLESPSRPRLWLIVPIGLGSWCSKKQFCKKCKFGCWTLNTTDIGPSWCI